MFAAVHLGDGSVIARLRSGGDCWSGMGAVA